MVWIKLSVKKQQKIDVYITTNNLFHKQYIVYDTTPISLNTICIRM